MKRDFEEYFPLPFHIEEDETGQLRTLCPASGTSFMDFGIVEGPLEFDGYDVQEYLVKCANLMPEAVEVLNEADDHMGALLAAVCDDCPKLGTEDCEECPPYKTLRKIGVLLAKLEGGETA